MTTLAAIAHMLVRITAPLLIVLGVLFWTGNAETLIPLHMLLGIVLVLSLWTLAILAALAGVHPGRVALAIVWGVIVPLLGITQTRLLPGSAHWIVQVLHLLVGIAAIAQAEGLARSMKARAKRTPVAQLQP